MSDDEKQIPTIASPVEKVPTANVEVMDDPRTQALTEALQSSNQSSK